MLNCTSFQHLVRCVATFSCLKGLCAFTCFKLGPIFVPHFYVSFFWFSGGFFAIGFSATLSYYFTSIWWRLLLRSIIFLRLGININELLF